LTDKIIQVGNWTQGAKRENPQRGRVYDPSGIAPSLTCMGGGNLQPFIIVRNEHIELESSADEE
jgi:DNA (cytosine-5)-methyltransferase 1